MRENKVYLTKLQYEKGKAPPGRHRMSWRSILFYISGKRGCVTVKKFFSSLPARLLLAIVAGIVLGLVLPEKAMVVVVTLK